MRSFENKLEASLALRVGATSQRLAKVQASALAQAQAAATNGATCSELGDAIKKSLDSNRWVTTASERKALKYATLAQVESTHYSSASRYHGDERAAWSSHNLPKAVLLGERPPEEMSRAELRTAITAVTEPLQQDAEDKALHAFAHIQGWDLNGSSFVSVAENPVAFARLSNAAAQTIATHTTARSDYLIPNQHLTRPRDIERAMLGMPETTAKLAEYFGVASIFHEDPRWGQKIYTEASATEAVSEALFLANTHLDNYLVHRSSNPYHRPTTPQEEPVRAGPSETPA